MEKFWRLQTQGILQTLQITRMVILKSIPCLVSEHVTGTSLLSVRSGMIRTYHPPHHNFLSADAAQQRERLCTIVGPHINVLVVAHKTKELKAFW